MSPDILPGLAAGASAPPPQIGPAATGPPGDAGLSTLFASLLAQSGGPQTKGGAISEPPSKQIASASPRTFTLPIKAAPTKPTKLDPMKPLPPPTAGVTAETQNAMDTAPVSGPRKAKASETKPGGELPLLEARTTPSAASPAPPVLFVVTPLMPVAVPPQVVKQAEPAAVPQAIAGTPSADPLLPALPVAPSVVPALAVQALSAQALPVPVVLRPGPPAAVPPAISVAKSVAKDEALPAVGVVQVLPAPALVLPNLALPSALPALPKTFTLPATTPERPLPVAVPQPATVASSVPKESVAVLPRPAAEKPYVVTGRTLTVPAQTVPSQAISAQTVPAQAADVVEPALIVKDGGIPVPPSPKAEKAALSPPTPKTAGVAATASLRLDAPRPTISVSAPTQISAVATAPQAVAMAAAPIRQSQSVPLYVQPIEMRKTESISSSAADPQAPATKISLKSLAVSADNNTRTQTLTLNKPGPVPLKPEGVGEPSERPVTKVGDGGREVEESSASAAPVPTPAPAAPTQTLSAAPAPLTRPDRAEVIRQVADAVGAMPTPARPGAASQMTLQLHPRDWGQLQISVRVSPAVQGRVTQPQTVTAHVIAASPQIKAVLESGSGDLRHVLRQAGLHLDKLTVTVQPPDAGVKQGTTPGSGHHLNGGSGGQSQPEARPNGNGPQAGGASSASFTGSPQGGREGGQQAPSQPASYGTVESVEEPATEQDTPRRAASGQVDMRA